MLLPNADRAFIDDAKLRDYALNEAHLHGGEKARLFRSILGFTRDDWQALKQAILDAARTQQAVSRGRNDFGQLYNVDFECRGPKGSATLRTAWIVRHDEDFPRLVTCYPLR